MGGLSKRRTVLAPGFRVSQLFEIWLLFLIFVFYFFWAILHVFVKVFVLGRS